MRKPPRRLCEGDMLPCWYWTGDRWRPAWATKKLTRGPNKGAWWVLVRVHRANRLGNWEFRWLKRRAKERHLQWIK